MVNNCRTQLVSVFFALASAIAQAGQTIVLPPVDLAISETAQVNIMSSAASYPGWSFVVACQASVTFYGADGSADWHACYFHRRGRTRNLFGPDALCTNRFSSPDCPGHRPDRAELRPDIGLDRFAADTAVCGHFLAGVG